MINRTFLILVIFCFLSSFSPGKMIAQDSIVDTLLIELENAKDTNEVIILNQLSREMTRINLETAMQ